MPQFLPLHFLHFYTASFDFLLHGQSPHSLCSLCHFVAKELGGAVAAEPFRNCAPPPLIASQTRVLSTFLSARKYIARPIFRAFMIFSPCKFSGPGTSSRTCFRASANFRWRGVPGLFVAARAAQPRVRARGLVIRFARTPSCFFSLALFS